MGAGLALPALAGSLPIGSSLLISALLPSRGLLCQRLHRPLSRPSINVQERTAPREGGRERKRPLIFHYKCFHILISSLIGSYALKK